MSWGLMMRKKEPRPVHLYVFEGCVSVCLHEGYASIGVVVCVPFSWFVCHFYAK